MVSISGCRVCWDTVVVGELFGECQSCQIYIHLPDVSMSTVTHLFELLTSGKTDLHDEEERKRVMQLQRSVGCNVITRFKRMRPDLKPGQCRHCLR